jgi:hypothetical protein
MVPDLTPRLDHEMLRRIQVEFLEMPGLRITQRQAGRLWGLDRASCVRLLESLVDAKFLLRTPDGSFMRIEHAMPVKMQPRSKVAVA